MIDYGELKVGEIVYMIETGPVILELEVLGLLHVDGEDRIKVKGPDLTFEVTYNDVGRNTFFNYEEAKAHAIKHIYVQVNELIQSVTENGLNDYYDLDKEVEESKKLFPEIFI